MSRNYVAIAHDYARRMVAAGAEEAAIKTQMLPLLARRRALLADAERDDFALAEVEKSLAPYKKLLRQMPARACKWVVLACQRQLDDLTRKRFKYRFDEARAAHVCKFIELLPHTKGEWAKKKLLITLEPWQIFILVTVFGWVDSQERRRFKVTYKEIPRKNAKSTVSSGVGLYMLTADGEGGPEVVSAATTKDQAKIVWGDAHKMGQKCAGLQQRFGLRTSAHSIYTEAGGSFLALARDQGGNLDGLNVHCAIIDELHAHKTREVVDVMETATGARSQPLLWQITTAGFNLAGICYETRTYTQKVLAGVITDHEHFGIIYTIDEGEMGDDWADPSSWQKANPNWGVSVSPEDVARKGHKALKTPAARGNFQTKHLNVWVNAAEAWMDMRAWGTCGDESLRLEDFRGETCCAAVDLATKTDVAALVLLFQRGDAVYLFARFYLPQSAVEGEENAHYAGWAAEGQLIVTPGNVIDQNRIQDDVRDLAAAHELRVLGFDPWQAMKFAAELAEEGLPVHEYRNTVQNMSEPMKELHALVVQGRLRHTGCPVMTWMMSNVVAHLDAKENIFPRKENPKNKIDGPVAAIMAMGELLHGPEDAYIYQGRGFIEL